MTIDQVRAGSYHWTQEHISNARLDNRGLFDELNHYNQRSKYFILGGLIIRAISMLGWSPMSLVHELCHAAAVGFTGGTLTETAMRYVRYLGGNELVILAAGYWGELLIYSLAGCIGPSRRFGQLLGGMAPWLLFEALYGDPRGDFVRINSDFHNRIFVMAWVMCMCFLTYSYLSRGKVKYKELPEEYV